jgi:CubicO group peptidase (beta-lactamase class C family)
MWLALLACRQPAPLEDVPWCRDDPAYDALIARVIGAMSAGNIPGASFAMIEDGRLACADVAGVTALGGSEPVTRETRFNFGSVSKMLTATAVLDATEDGELALDEPVMPAVALHIVPTGDPERDNPGAITLRELLSHSAGVRDEYEYDVSCPDWPDLKSYAEAPWMLSTPPGLAYHYSNPGYAMAGRALEVADGRPFADSLADRVFGPFDMAFATQDRPTVFAEPHATGAYEVTDDEGRAIDYVLQTEDQWTCPGWGPPAGTWGTAADLGRFVEHVLGDGGSLEPDSVAALSTAVIASGPWDDYGLGLDLFTLDGEPVFGHNGRYDGFLTQVMVLPDRGLGMVALFNSDSEAPSSLVRDQLMDDAGLEFQPSTDQPDPESWSEFDGIWYDPLSFGTLDIEAERGNLYATRVETGVKERMTWLGPDTFVLPDPQYPTFPDTVTFVREEGLPSPRYMVARWGSAVRVAQSR